MKNALGNEIITLTLHSENNQKEILLAKIKDLENVKKISTKNEQITVFTANGTEVLPLIFQASTELGIKIKTTLLTHPTLDDVFISYTGRELRDDGGNFNLRREHSKMRKLRA